MESYTILKSEIESGVYDKFKDNLEVSQEQLNELLVLACSHKGRERFIVDLLNYGADDYNMALIAAADSQNILYAVYFYEHGVTNFNNVIQHITVKNNVSPQNVQLVFGSSTIKDKRDIILATAARLGDEDLMVDLKTDDSNLDLAYAYAAECNQISACDLLVKWGATNHNWALCMAAKSGATEMIDFAYKQGADAHNSALTLACKNNFYNKIKYFLEKGATNYDVALEHAIKSELSSVVKFCLATIKKELSAKEVSDLVSSVKSTTPCKSKFINGLLNEV